MTRARNPEQTRRAILDAARREFALLGFAGGRTDAIAAAAGVNKRMLYHYFGSKERVYAAVLTDRLGAHRAVPPARTLAAHVEQRIDEVRADPDDLRLLMWEALTDAAPDAVAEATRSATWRDRVATLAALLRDGRFTADVDPAQFELALTALTVFPLAFRQLAHLITGGAPGDPAFDAAHREFLGVLLRRLAPAPQQPPAIASPAQRKPRVRLTAATISRVD